MSPDRLFRLLAAITAIGLCAVAAAQEPEPAIETAATRVVEKLHAALLEASEDPRYSLERRYEILAPIVRDSHDLDYIVRFILRRHWNELSSQQIADFRERFERLSITSYASRFTGLSASSLTTTGAERLRPDRVQVDTRLDADNGRVVTLSYTLNADDAGWRIINVIADGVSDLALRRSEYSRLLGDESFTALLDHVDAQIAELH